MRYLLMFLAALLLVWLWRGARTKPSIKQQHKPPLAAGALTMVACAQCGVHIPEGDAIKGSSGVYCCAAHLESAEH